MQNKADKSKEEAKKRIVTHIVNQLKAGKTKMEVITGLEQAGMDRMNATQVVDSIHNEMLVEAEKEELDSTTIPKALLAAGVAAVVGGAIWGLIVSYTDTEIGFMAIGIGLLAGYAVVWFTGRKGLPLQIIAVGGALVGILIGKYLYFYDALKTYAIEEIGAGAAEQITIFSIDVIQFFFENIFSFSSFYDILWIVFAVAAAWGIPRGIGLKSSGGR